MVIARKKYFIIPKDPSLFGLSHLPANWNKAGSLSWAKRQNFWSLIKVVRAALTRFSACSHIYTNPWKLPSLAITCVQLNTQKVVFKLHTQIQFLWWWVSQHSFEGLSCCSKSQKINTISNIWTQNRKFVTGSPTGPTEEENSYDYEEEEEAPGETRWDSFLFSSAFYSGLISPLKIVLLVEIFSCAQIKNRNEKSSPQKNFLPSEAQVV